MNAFKTHTLETASAGSRPLLEEAKKAFGSIPNLLAVMAEAPALLESYKTIGKIFDSSSLTATERQIVLLSVSRFHECEYCMAAHSVIASMSRVPNDVVDAIRDDQPIGDTRLETLRLFTIHVVEQRGLATEGEIDRFLEAGFTQAQLLEVIVGIGMKTLSNYTNHLAKVELDATFASRAWKPDKAA